MCVQDILDTTQPNKKIVEMKGYMMKKNRTELMDHEMSEVSNYHLIKLESECASKFNNKLIFGCVCKISLIPLNQIK